MPLSPYATKPYCLDSEFLPRSLLEKGIPDLNAVIEKERGKAAYREFIRSLIFSPQVVIGRETTTGHPVFVEAITQKKEFEALINLFEKDRLYILLMVSDGNKGKQYQERSLLDFFEHSRFRGQSNQAAVDGWRSLVGIVGDEAIPYVRLNAEQSSVMGNRFTSFFSIPPTDISLLRSFRDSLGRSPTPEEIADLQNFWKDDLEEFVYRRKKKGDYTISRSAIYDEYIRPKGPSDFFKSVPSAQASDFEARRQRLRIPFKLMTDLAYNANVPTTLSIKSFVPPDMPDPLSLPAHLFQPPKIYNPEMEAHQNAVRQAYREIVECRTRATERFFYEHQIFEQLPDIGSFTLADTVTVMGWPEWLAFKTCQYAVLRFERVAELQGLMRDYWQALKLLHMRLEKEAKKRSAWRRVSGAAVDLAISITAHIMGHAMLPDLLHSAPWWQTVAAASSFAQPLHAGLDIVVHGVEKGTDILLTEVGFKDGGMREFTISQEMQELLEALKKTEEQLSNEKRAADAVIANASNRIASES